MFSGTVECAPFERAEKVCFVAQFQFETMFVLLHRKSTELTGFGTVAVILIAVCVYYCLYIRTVAHTSFQEIIRKERWYDWGWIVLFFGRKESVVFRGDCLSVLLVIKGK